MKPWKANVILLSLAGGLVYFFFWFKKDPYHASIVMGGVGLFVLILLFWFTLFAALRRALRGRF